MLVALAFGAVGACTSDGGEDDLGAAVDAVDAALVDADVIADTDALVDTDVLMDTDAPVDTDPGDQNQSDAPVDTAETDDATPTADTADGLSPSDGDSPADVAPDPDVVDAADEGDQSEPVDSTETSDDSSTDADTLDQDDGGGMSPYPPATIGFGATMTGKFVVFDLTTMKELIQIGNGHAHVHGCAILPGQKVAYIPNRDVDDKKTMGSLERWEQVGPTPDNWKMIYSKPAGLKMGVLAATPDAKTIVMSEGEMLIFPEGGAPPKLSTIVSVFRTDLDKTVLQINTDSPMSVAVSKDGSKAYAGNWDNKTISVIDIATGTIDAALSLPTNGPVAKWIGPSRITPSHDGKWMLSCDLTDNAAVLFPIDDIDKAVIVPTDGLAHWCEFSEDDKTFYVVTWEKMIPQGDEVASANVPSAVVAFDTATQKQLGSFVWKFNVGHAAVAHGTPWLFLSASFGGIVRLDKSLQLTGEMVVNPTLALPMMTICF